jgi:dTDP-4-amino-4,6-dideoxygalactose transaminase
MPDNPIPLSAPWITDREISAITKSLKEGRVSSNEENLRGAVSELKRITSADNILLTTSCTSSLELALECLDLNKGDEVILPSFTYVSTANAILCAGGIPVLTDIEEETLSLDLDDVKSKITERTKAIMPVHYASISCDMDALLNIAKNKNIAIVEDAAHAIGATYKEKHLGTIGDLGCLSFHDTKNCTCGEGGALLVNNPELMNKVEQMYEKGTNRSAFLRGEIDSYSWTSKGRSYALASPLAELLQVQLERFDEIHSKRKILADKYREGLQILASAGHIRLINPPEYAKSNDHIAFFLVEDPAKRDPLIRHLKSNGIGAASHYVPLHLSPYALEHLNTQPGQFPVTERVASSIVRLPLFPQLPLEDCNAIIDKIIQFFH